jgi:hypothetical protein
MLGQDMFFKGYFMMFMNIFGKACLFSLQDFSKWHFLSAPSLFFKRRRRMGGMKVSSVGEGTL